MELKTLLDNASLKQQKYFNVDSSWSQVPEAERAKLIQKMLAYIVEETVEVNRELNEHYKPFKKNTSEINRDKLLEEVVDIFIYWLGVAVITGESTDAILNKIASKLKYNETRVDHNLSKQLVHYVYELTLVDGKKYIGARSCYGKPSDDAYLSSSKTLDKTQVVHKEILSVHQTRHEALAEEARLLWKHDVNKNPNFVNVKGGSISKKYKFIHVDSGETLMCTPYELSKRYNLNSGDITRVINKVRGSVGGWKVEH